MLSASFLVFGCSDHSQQLEDRVSDLKKKIEQLQAQLDAAKQAGKEQDRSSSQSDPSAALPTKAALESSYETSSKELKDKIAAKLTGFSVENYTTHSVQMPEDPYPFTSNISFSIRASNGKTYQMDLPVKADYAGKWIFPEADEIVARINSAKSMTPITEKEAAAANTASPGQEAAFTRPPIMDADGTIVIQWGDSQKSNQPTPKASDSTSQASNQPSHSSAPPTSATEAPSAVKPPVMPVNRDVHIEFTPPPSK